MPEARFDNRRHAGRVLAAALRSYAGRADVVVLGLPRGGVPVAREVADALGAPLDVFCVRKLGVPGHRELAFGAIASGDVRVLNGQVISAHRITDEEIDAVTAHEREQLSSQERAFREGRPRAELSGKVALLVDDGLATGATMRAAAGATRALGAAQVVCAVPVSPPGVAATFADVCDIFIAAVDAEHFRAVGQFYDDFGQTTDDEVCACLS
jgi:predicted phosphoribosyltransferase